MMKKNPIWLPKFFNFLMNLESFDFQWIDLTYLQERGRERGRTVEVIQMKKNNYRSLGLLLWLWNLNRYLQYYVELLNLKSWTIRHCMLQQTNTILQFLMQKLLTLWVKSKLKSILSKIYFTNEMSKDTIMKFNEIHIWFSVETKETQLTEAAAKNNSEAMGLELHNHTH